MATQVLVYDFFRDSTVSAAEWRLVLGLVPEIERDSRPVPEFVPNKFRGVGNEVSWTSHNLATSEITHS